MPAQHNLYLSAIPGENPDIFSVHYSLAEIHGTGNPIHQSK